MLLLYNNTSRYDHLNIFVRGSHSSLLTWFGSSCTPSCVDSDCGASTWRQHKLSSSQLTGRLMIQLLCMCVYVCVRERVSVCVRPDMDTTGAHCWNRTRCGVTVTAGGLQPSDKTSSTAALMWYIPPPAPPPPSPAMSKSLKKRKHHWTNKVRESVLCRNEEGELGLELKGGAENGQFPVVGELLPGGAPSNSGQLFQDELLLEVNDTPVAGLTTRDVHAVVKHSKDPVRLKCVKQGNFSLFPHFVHFCPQPLANWHAFVFWQQCYCLPKLILSPVFCSVLYPHHVKKINF